VKGVNSASRMGTLLATMRPLPRQNLKVYIAAVKWLKKENGKNEREKGRIQETM
jgi:hypothetical protein